LRWAAVRAKAIMARRSAGGRWSEHRATESATPGRTDIGPARATHELAMDRADAQPDQLGRLDDAGAFGELAPRQYDPLGLSACLPSLVRMTSRLVSNRSCPTCP